MATTKRPAAAEAFCTGHGEFHPLDEFPGRARHDTSPVQSHCRRFRSERYGEGGRVRPGSAPPAIAGRRIAEMLGRRVKVEMPDVANRWIREWLKAERRRSR
jgi:hypothetical protein